jgi:hypothetical protein
MKQETIAWTFRAGVAALAFAVPLAANSTPAQATTPCTYVGRVMDAEHVGFDTNRVAELAAYDASGKLVATSKTFYKTDSRRNYALRIPMASKAVGGALTPGSPVTIEVTEPNGTVWTGVVVDPDATLGGPGSVKEVDIVLAQCTNEYGIDDELLNDLYWEWRYSEYYVAGETFNPRKDHDGDGMSTLGEALSGTNPFDPSDCLAILSFQRGALGGSEKDILSFVCRPGRSYTLEVTESLENPDWKPKAFYLNESGTPVNYISVPAVGASEDTPTVYLLPQTGPKAFFRIKAD